MPRVIVERSMHDQFLSNTYLVADREPNCLDNPAPPHLNRQR